jgi:hypothetical protein
MAQDLETLFERAEAATLQAKRLKEMISASQELLIALIQERRNQRFEPVDRRISYPPASPHDIAHIRRL